MKPIDPAWTEPTEAQVADFRRRLEDVVSTLVGAISVREQQMGVDHPHRDQAVVTADWQLAMLRALRETRDAAEVLSEKYARGAGAGGINYPQLGAAWGVSRQAARKKWPGAVSAVNEQANREPVHFEAFGGEARVVFHPEFGGWWWIATAANRKREEAPDDLTYDTSEEAAAAAGAFLAANATTTAEETNR